MLTYGYDPTILELEETPNGEEMEFKIKLLKPEAYTTYLKQVEDFFDNNEIYTDVLFYYYKNHEYRIIVRFDYYEDFILMLMRHHLLQKVEWQL